MAKSISRLFVDILANTTKLERDLKKSGRKLGPQLAAIGKAAGKTLGVGLAAGFAAGALLTREFSKFQKAFNEVTTIAGGTRAEMGALKKELLGVSRALGVELVEATQGLYQVLSAGVPKENAATFLATASKAAIGGVTDVRTAVDGLTTAVNAYGMDTAAVGHVADVMFMTVKRGKTTFAELSQSLSIAAPLAKASGISFEELSAAVATLTKQGVPTAQAMTQLRQVMVALQKPNADMLSLLKKLNVETGQQLLDQKGLVGAMTALQSASDRPGLAKALGRVEGLNAVLGLTGEKAAMFAEDLAAMQGSAGAASDAFNVMQNGLSAFMDRIRSELIGQFIPALDALYNGFEAAGGGADVMGDKIARNVEKFVNAAITGFGYLANVFRGIQVWAKMTLLWITTMMEGFLRLVQAIPDGINVIIGGVETLINGTISTVESVVNTAIAGINLYFQSVTDGFNAIIRGINAVAEKVPWLKQQLSEIQSFQIDGKLDMGSVDLGRVQADGINNLVAGAADQRKQLWGEVVELVNQPLPSTQIKNWRATVETEVEGAATTVAKAVQDIKVSTTENVFSKQDAAVASRGTQQFFDNTLTATRQFAGEQSGIFKALSIANTTIKTYESATSAYSAMASIPYIGPILGAAAATAAIAAGMANVAAIQGQSLSFEGGGSFMVAGTTRSGGVDGRGGVPYLAHPGEQVQVTDFRRGNPSGGGENVTVNFNFEAGVTRAEIASILPSLEQRAVAGVLEAYRRGGTYRRGFKA